jgi:hypothetical protein
MSLQQVAERIRERNNALITEQATLELLQDQLELAKKQLHADQLATQATRKRLLTAMRARHGVELDVLTKKDETDNITRELTKLQSSIETTRLKSNELRQKFEQKHAPLYAHHEVSTSLHTMQLESLLVKAQKKKQRREEKLHHLKSAMERQRIDTEKMREETERIRNEIEDFDRREEEEDEEMVGLTMQIRQVLAKVRKSVGVRLIL